MISISLKEFNSAIEQAKKFFFDQINQKKELDNAFPKEENLEEQITENPQKTDAMYYYSKIFRKSVHIYSHLDADGLSSAAILAQTLKREKIGYQITILRQLEVEYVINIKDEINKYNRFIIFADFGSGQLQILNENLPENSFLILDHHKPENFENQHRINHINPYFYDIKGENEISGAGVCYLFSKAINPKNQNLSPFAIIGAIGDMQNNNDKHEFQGINLEILEEAINSGKITLEKNIAIARTRPLTYSLAYTLPESITGISNNIEDASNFLRQNNIQASDELNESRCLMDLSEMEKKSLTNALLQYAIVKNGMDASIAKKLVTTFYILTDFDPKIAISDAKEMSSLLNACGRSNKQSIGIAALLGDKEALDIALEDIKDYRKEISRAIQSAKSHIREYEFIRTLYDESIDEKMIGTICSILMHSDLSNDKPLIAFADSDNHTMKVSARGDQSLIKMGLDLGAVMRNVCQEMGIENPAGGHPPAAGAKINSMQVGEFITKVNENVSLQLKK